MMKNKEPKAPTKFVSFLSFLKILWKNPKGKAILFFVFYFFFFLFIGISYRMTPKNSYTLEDFKENEEVASLSIDSLIKGNYAFTYQEEINGVKKILSGKAYNRMKEVKEQSHLYFLYSGISLERVENVWKVSKNPFYFPEVMEEDAIKQTLSKATFLSKTVYQNGENLYQYEIATTTLLSLYHNENVDLDDLPNQIQVKTDRENQIQEIIYEYSSYDTYLTKEKNKVKIEITYQDYGKIEPLEIPE